MSRRLGDASNGVDSFDPSSRTIVGTAIDVAGDTPPAPATSWWPWIIGAGVLGVLWWLTREDKYHGPLVAGGAA